LNWASVGETQVSDSAGFSGERLGIKMQKAVSA
jgi:hypothetical protein